MNYTIDGYEMQNELVYTYLERVVGNAVKRRGSMIIEGVHLSGVVIQRLVCWVDYYLVFHLCSFSL